MTGWTWICAARLLPRAFDGEHLVDGGAFCVAAVFPRGDLRDQGRLRADTANSLGKIFSNVSVLSSVVTDSPRVPSFYSRDLLLALGRAGSWARIGGELQMKQIALDESTLGRLLDIAFFASMTKEEGRTATFSLAISPRGAGRAHRLWPGEPLSVELLRKLSAACDADGTSIRVSLDKGGWFVWGIGLNQAVPGRGATFRDGDQFVVLTVSEPGALRLRWEEDVFFTFAGGRGAIPEKAEWLTKLLEAALPPPSHTTIGLHHLSRIYTGMRAHGRGGALLVVPEARPGSRTREVLMDIDMRYPIQPSIPGEAAVIGGVIHDGPLPTTAYLEERTRRDQPEADDPKDEFSFHRRLHYAIARTDAEAEMIGRLTAIDGVVVTDHTMCVLGFGGKLPVATDFSQTQVLHIDPRDRHETTTTVGELFGGMRHKSVAAFCAKFGHAVALVQSQDGALTLMLAEPGKVLRVIKPLERLVSFLER